MTELSVPDWEGIRQGLLAPFPRESLGFLPKNISNGQAQALPYVDAREVMQRLDQVVGPQHWEFDYTVEQAQPVRIKGTLKIHGVSKSDAGEAGNEDEPLKAAVSDAVKRCAVHFGVARYLYALPAKRWYPYDSQKRRWSEYPQLDPVDESRALRQVGYLGDYDAPAPGISVSSPLPDQARRERPVPTRAGSPPSGGSGCTKCGASMNAGQIAFSQQNHEELTCPKCASGRTAGTARVATGSRRF